MTVIKGNNPDGERTEAPFNHFVREEAEKLARDILQQARQKAETIIRSAHRKKKEIKEQARQQGHREGYREGREEGKEDGRKEGREKGREAARQEIQKQTAGLSESLSSLLDELEQTLDHHERIAKKQLLELALKIAETVVKSSLEIDSELVRNNVERAVELAASRLQPTIHVHPDVISNVESFLPELKRKFHELDEVEVKTDDSLEPGGCRVTTQSGEVDADIDTQLQQIRNQLLNQKSHAGKQE